MKTITANSVYLKGGSYHITEDPEDAYRVLYGRVFVYVVPIRSSGIGRRTLIYEASPGEYIPAFSFVDIDKCKWNFCLTAAEEAALEITSHGATNPLREKFAQRAGIENFAQEGYNNGLVDKYHMKLVREDSFLIRTRLEKENNAKKTDKLVSSAISGSNAAQNETENGIYNMTSLICREVGIPIVPYEKLTAFCGKDISINDIARMSHFPCREVTLEPSWHKRWDSFILAFTEKGEACACIPRKRRGYYIVRSDAGETVLTKKIAEELDSKAYAISCPFHKDPLMPKDFALFCLKGIRAADVLTVMIMTFLSAFAGLLVPLIIRLFYDSFIPAGSDGIIIRTGILAAAVMLGNAVFLAVRNAASLRISGRIGLRVQNAVYFKLFELPENFFEKYESAELAGRVQDAGAMGSSLADSAVSAIVSAVCFCFFLFQMFSLSRRMAAVSLVFLLLTETVMAVISSEKLRLQRQLLNEQGQADSLMYQFLAGIDKIRISGVEDRAVLEYLKPFVKKRADLNSFERLNGISCALRTLAYGLLFTVIYLMSCSAQGLTAGSFVAFISSLGTAAAALKHMNGGITGFRMILLAYERVRPILETPTDSCAGKEPPAELDGSVDIEHLSFSYDGHVSVLNDITLHIKPGEYIGITGSSGCGKSTLMKLMLGFEKPDSGRIYYSNQDIEQLDKQLLRKKFGVVLQNGKLIPGSIYDNITAALPKASGDDVENIIRTAGLKDDTDNMPMGLDTLLDEDCRTVSGGQKQRILIARALAGKPRILFFDEATSALDNASQAAVCAGLEKLDCTRIVIAHRLSAIRRCDRIIVLGNGRIEEEGTYDELIEKDGIFRELAGHQTD